MAHVIERRRRVAVTHEKDDGTIEVIFRRHTIAEAERDIADLEKTDPDGVHAGKYGIDAPEELVNPLREIRSNG